MFMRSFRMVLLALVALALAGLAAAQGEPTIKQIYDEAQSGHVDKARQMTQEVLRNHPKSAKAHFVMAELDVRQGNVTQSRDQLAQAESLAPGLPFARPEAVQALRARLSPQPAVHSPNVAASPVVSVPGDATRAPSFPWGMVLLAGAIIAVGAFVIRSRAAARSAATPGYPAGGYGAAATSPAWGAQQPGYGGPQPGYGPQPAQPGMGGQIMGGLATGLAVGAGALAAQEIGRRMLGEHAQHGMGSVADSHAASDSRLANDAGLGAIDGTAAGSALPEDFGIRDVDSWDDGGSFDVGGGDDGGSWDS
jgi:hypothetical protein